MQQWIQNTLESGAAGLAVPLAAFLLGAVSSVTCACCTFPLLGAVAGYSGTTGKRTHRAKLMTALLFMLGVIIATILLGTLAGLFGQVVRLAMGRYWKLAAGFIIIVFGLTVLRLLPFKLPKRKKSFADEEPKGLLTAAMFGFMVGGAIGFCSLPCNPGIFVVLGVTVASGISLWTFVMLIAYAIGFSLPLAALMLSISLGTSLAMSDKAKKVFRTTAGILLIIAGFYLLATL